MSCSTVDYIETKNKSCKVLLLPRHRRTTWRRRLKSNAADPVTTTHSKQWMPRHNVVRNCNPYARALPIVPTWDLLRLQDVERFLTLDLIRARLRHPTTTIRNKNHREYKSMAEVGIIPTTMLLRQTSTIAITVMSSIVHPPPSRHLQYRLLVPHQHRPPIIILPAKVTFSRRLPRPKHPRLPVVWMSHFKSLRLRLCHRH